MTADKREFGSCSIKMHGNVVVWSKWQIVIPNDVRKMLDISPGDSMVVITKNGEMIGLMKSSNIQKFINQMQEEIAMLQMINSSS